MVVVAVGVAVGVGVAVAVAVGVVVAVAVVVVMRDWFRTGVRCGCGGELLAAFVAVVGRRVVYVFRCEGGGESGDWAAMARECAGETPE